MRKLTTTIHIFEEEDYLNSKDELKELCPRIKGYMSLYPLEANVEDVCRKILTFYDLKATSFSEEEMSIVKQLSLTLGEIDHNLGMLLKKIFLTTDPNLDLIEANLSVVERKGTNSLPDKDVIMRDFKEKFRSFIPFIITSSIDENGYTDYEFTNKDYMDFVISYYKIAPSEVEKKTTTGHIVIRQKLNYLLDSLCKKRVIRKSRHGHYVFKDKTVRVPSKSKSAEQPSWLNN